jgi:surface antigen
LHFSYDRHIAAGVFAQFPPVAALLSLAAACALSGCSIAVPIAPSNSRMWGAVADDITGSIPKPPAKLSSHLDAEDLRRATAAMNTALDPQGSGASVHWDNPKSGAHGAFTPQGPAYPVDARICRAFVADINAGETSEKLEGSACREKSADWALSELKSRKS